MNLQTESPDLLPSSQAAVDPSRKRSPFKNQGKPIQWGAAATSESGLASALHSRLIDQAYEEYCQLEETGKPVDPDSFCERFPLVQSSLGRLLQAHRFLVEHKDILPEGVEPAWPEVGADWAGFHLVSELGRGSFARVYQATEAALGGRVVALKVSPRGDLEAATLGRLEHPGIVPAFSVQKDEAAGLWAVCMPYRGSATFLRLQDHFNALRGQKKKIDGAAILQASADPFDPSGQAFQPNPELASTTFTGAVRWLASRLAQALAFIHDRGIYHCDLKPSNLLLQPDGSPLLLDFNLSADPKRPDGLFGGTPAYMAPEQLEAMIRSPQTKQKVDQRTDLFSFGVIFYELLAGQHPFGPLPLKLTSKETRALLLERQRQGFVPLRKACPEVDASLANAIEACLALDPEQRPASAHELFQRLAPTKRNWRLFAPFARWPKTAAVLLILLLGLGIALGLGMMHGVSTPDLIENAKAALAEKNYRSALSYFNQALNQDPENADALLQRGFVYLKLGDAHSANADFSEADRLKPNGRARALLGFSFQQIKQFEPAEKCYEKAADLGFRPPWLLNNLGTLYLQNTTKTNRAESLLLEAVQLDPATPAIRHNLALVFLQKGLNGKEKAKSFFEEGIVHGQAALAQGPRATNLLFDCAQLCGRAAPFDKSWVEPALNYLKEALEQGLDPKKLQSNSFLTLQAEPRFQAFQDRAPSGKTPTSALRVLEPPSID